MVIDADILLIAKRAAAIFVFICVIFAPAYLAAVNDRDKYDKMRIRCASILFGWTIVGWVFALFLAAKK